MLTLLVVRTNNEWMSGKESRKERASIKTVDAGRVKKTEGELSDNSVAPTFPPPS